MKNLILGAAMVAATAHATCPISECNYLDPQYKAALDAWNKCTNPMVDQFYTAMDKLAVLYPRFGVAWHAQEADMNATVSDPASTSAAIDESRRRFEDRILRTAEPEALQAYNQWQVKVKQQVAQCGPTPEPPRR